ncbi:hypothetical protein GCM10009636_29570 [Arthrobacter koreensis]
MDEAGSQREPASSRLGTPPLFVRSRVPAFLCGAGEGSRAGDGAVDSVTGGWLARVPGGV